MRVKHLCYACVNKNCKLIFFFTLNLESKNYLRIKKSKDVKKSLKKLIFSFVLVFIEILNIVSFNKDPCDETLTY